MSEGVHRFRRGTTFVVIIIGLITTILMNSDMWQPVVPSLVVNSGANGDAAKLLTTIEIKGRAPKTGYKRTAFGDGWKVVGGCDMRNIILNRDMINATMGDGCKILTGVLQDPYTGREIQFMRGADTSDDVQIDHVVALSDAWQKGAQNLTTDQRELFANDPLELLAVEGKANQTKSDSDAASWLPANKSFRCQYVARQVAVKAKYQLWMTQAEYDTVKRVLDSCPGQPLPAV